MWLDATLPFGMLAQLVLFALGISYVITGSKIGYPVRFVWCRLTRWAHNAVVSPWKLVTCPPCNAWWAGAALAFWAELWWTDILQVAFTACGIVAVVQAALGGDGIAASEDFEELFNG